MERELEKAVRTRAGDACEYCRMPQQIRRLKYPIDHVIAKQHGGTDELSNLAVACGRCNRHKGPNLSGIDPETRLLTRLFHPRRDRWADHFRWIGPHIEGISAEGRASVVVLAMNLPDDVAVRSEMIAGGWKPPTA
jgi:hypothetical protein